MLYAEGLISEGFVTHADREDNLTTITQAQAQTSYDSFMDNLLASWEDDERIKPSKETLPS